MDQLEQAWSGVKAILRSYFRPSCCINATAVLRHVCREHELQASPFAVRARIYAPRWSVGIGYYRGDAGKSAWPGHLVLRVHDYLVDATIDQANRPEHGIVLPPIVIVPNVAASFWAGDNMLESEPGPFRLLYEPRPKETSYMGTPGWQFRDHVEGAAAREILKLPGIGKALAALKV